MIRPERTVIRNGVVTVAAVALGYLVLTVSFTLDMEFSRAGAAWTNIMTAADSKPDTSADPAAELENIQSLQRQLDRTRYIYLPIALASSAALIAVFSSSWQWSWVLTLLGCSYGLVSMAIVSTGNVGRGIAAALGTYVILAIAVTVAVCLRERRLERAA